MKIETSVEKIKNAISLAERITGKNLSLPILSSVLLVVENGVFKVKAMNLSLGVEIKIPAKIENEGILAINGSLLNNVFSNINPSEIVFIEGVDGNLIIKTKKSRVKIKGQSHEDFPTIPQVEGDSFSIESNKLIDGIKSVYYSSALSDIKPEISSVFIYSNGDDLYFVSTDSFRLAEKRVKLKKGVDLNGIIIPYKSVLEVLRFFSDVDGFIDISLSKNQISFSYENIYLTSRIIDGVYPDYKQIIPKETKTEVILLKQDLLNALKITNIFADKFNQIDFNVDLVKKVFELKSSNVDIGENETSIDASIKGEEILISCNYKYIIDCLPSVFVDSVSLGFNGVNKPILIRPVSDGSFLYLVMPMNR